MPRPLAFDCANLKNAKKKMTPVLLAGKSQVELLLLIITFSLREGRVIQHLLSDAHDKADSFIFFLPPVLHEENCIVSSFFRLMKADDQVQVVADQQVVTKRMEVQGKDICLKIV